MTTTFLFFATKFCEIEKILRNFAKEKREKFKTITLIKKNSPKFSQ
jgi:hypothetical protein